MNPSEARSDGGSVLRYFSPALGHLGGCPFGYSTRYWKGRSGCARRRSARCCFMTANTSIRSRYVGVRAAFADYVKTDRPVTGPGTSQFVGDPVRPDHDCPPSAGSRLTSPKRRSTLWIMKSRTSPLSPARILFRERVSAARSERYCSTSSSGSGVLSGNLEGLVLSVIVQVRQFHPIVASWMSSRWSMTLYISY
jgi:hypothetical protein